MKNKLAGYSPEEVRAYIEDYVCRYWQEDSGIFASRGGGSYGRMLRYGLPEDAIEYGVPKDAVGYGVPKKEICDAFQQAESTFAECLFSLIDEQEAADADVYKRAGVSKSVFSKIRQGQLPEKKTIIALAITLRLPLTKTQDLLQKAGYFLSNSLRDDLIVRGFIVAREYDIDKIRAVIGNKEICPEDIGEWRARYLAARRKRGRESDICR